MAVCRQTQCWTRSCEFSIQRQQKGTGFHTGLSSNMGTLKAHTHGDTLPPTRPQFLILPLPISQAFKHISLWWSYLF